MIAISKQLVAQKYIYKLHSARLRQAKWDLTLPLAEARRNDEVISLADSQVLRWIDELNGLVDADARAKELKSEIRHIKREPNSPQNKREIKRLYRELDEIQYKPDYMCLIIDKVKDYYRACEGFTINGLRYCRLLGTNGGIKNSTIVFVSERVVDELRRHIENGRNPDVPLVTAKLEAYKALTCSASTPVSIPHGVLVVPDVETTFIADYIYLTNENEGEPLMEERHNQEVTIDASDGFGLMLPSLAERWSQELGLDYITSGVNTRYSFEKGMVFTFDFLDFAENVAHSYIVKDAWGDEVDIRNVELILTTSMVKLWDSYPSCDAYLSRSAENGYTFGVTKTCPKVLENERSLNYQFIQPFDLLDDDIEALISPTMTEIKDVLGGDWRKTVLFLKGMGLNENNVERLDDDVVKALMIDPRMIDDPYVQSIVYQAIKNRINEAKIGVLNVHGNYSIVSGDPYALCQNIFGLPVTGLLKAGEIYNRYWADYGASELICFRAPMSCANNALKMCSADSEEIRYWYRWMNTCTIFNAWDLSANSLNGMDYDGDLLMTTDNEVLVNRHKAELSLMCAQRKAEKKISTEEDFIRSNIDSFGSDIGRTTNWITSMYEVRSHWPKNSVEFETLSYRIQAGQQAQQDSIDKAKGIICKPMPKAWYDRHTVNRIEDDETRTFYRRIVADKKPYFMRYIYPALMKQYNTFIKNTEFNSLCSFGMTVDELMAVPESDRTDEQAEFLKYYNYRMPVGVGGCVMNKICRRFEAEFDGHIGRHNASTPFDYTIMRSDAEYCGAQFNEVKRLYDSYNSRLKSYAVFAANERVCEDDAFAELSSINEEFRRQCSAICPNEKVLCNIVLDLCYTRKSTKKFAWSMCGHTIIQNLLEAHDNMVSFPVLDADGDIEYGGERFSMQQKQIEVVE